MSDLTFRQARDKVKFSVILMARRLTEPDENIPTCAFLYNTEDGITMVPISDSYLRDLDGMKALAHQDLPSQVRQKKANYVFLVVSLVTKEGEYIFLHGQSREDISHERALLLRGRRGHPLLQRWEVQSFPEEYLYQLVAPSMAHLS